MPFNSVVVALETAQQLATALAEGDGETLEL